MTLDFQLSNELIIQSISVTRIGSFINITDERSTDLSLPTTNTFTVDLGSLCLSLSFQTILVTVQMFDR